MKVKEESEKAGLKLNIQKTKIMESDHITSWQRDGETMETVTDFIFLDSKIVAEGDCSHEIKRWMLLRRKAMTNLESIIKSRDITLLTKFHLVKVAGSQHGSSHPWQRSCGEAWYAKASQDSRGSPLDLPEHLPKTRICLFYYFTTFTNSSDINKGLSPTTFSLKKINLEL